MNKRITGKILINAVTLLLFVCAKNYATAERGYDAAGGEYLILALPPLWYILKQTVRDVIAVVIKTPEDFSE